MCGLERPDGVRGAEHVPGPVDSCGTCVWAMVWFVEVHERVDVQELSAYLVDPVGVRNCWRFAVFLVMLLFGVYWVWSLAALVPTLRAAWRAHVFYRDCLGIPTRDLQTMQW